MGPRTATCARIRATRIARGLTQKDTATRSALTQTHYCRIELGQAYPRASTLERIALVLRIPTWYLRAEPGTEPLAKLVEAWMALDEGKQKLVVELAQALRR